MNRVLFLSLALCTLLTDRSAQGQEPQGGYHSVACIKVRDGKAAKFRDFLTDARKVVQADVDSGRITASYLLRTIFPAGNEARCDYWNVTVFPGPPAVPGDLAVLGKLLQNAQINMTAPEYVVRRSSLAQLVSAEMWQTAVSIGGIRKGDYAFINHMKVHDMSQYMELVRSIWKPMAESWVKDGTLHGWLVAVPVLPAGTGLSYQAVSVDVLSSWDGASSHGRWRKPLSRCMPVRTSNRPCRSWANRAI